MMARHVMLAIFLPLLKSAKGYPEGCPESQCLYGYAKHGALPQPGVPPYIIELDKTEYHPEDNITVTIRGKNGEKFTGFILRAHRSSGINDPEEIIGDFVQFTPEANRFKQVWKNTRPDIESNCVTQNDKSDKTEQKFVWRAPLQSEGDIVFRLGIVKDFETFWNDIESEVIRSKQPAVLDPGYTAVQPDFDDFLFHEDCGKTKGCFMYPRGCQGAQCDYIFAYQAIMNGTSFRFELAGHTDGFISIGLSDDKKMGGEVTVNCLRDEEGRLYIQNSYDPQLYQTRQANSDFSDMHIAYHDGHVYCSFVRPTVLTMVNSLVEKYGLVVSDLTESYYIFAARGTLYEGSNIIHKHVELPAVTATKVNLRKTEITSGNNLPVELQVHATFGVLGYLFVMGSALLLVRHYREELSRKCCAIPIWLQGHLVLLITAGVFAAVSVIVITVYLKKWTEYATIHAVFGLVALGMMLVNVVAGFLRPSPDSAKRLIFTWFHRIAGVLAYACAVVCLILGSRVELLTVDLQNKQTIVIAAGFGIIILTEVILEIIKCRTAVVKFYDVGENNMEKIGRMQMEELKPKSGCWGIKIFVFVVYLVVLTVIVTLALYYVYTL